MRFNVYYNQNGKGFSYHDNDIHSVKCIVQQVLESGGEITGIINVEDD